MAVGEPDGVGPAPAVVDAGGDPGPDAEGGPAGTSPEPPTADEGGSGTPVVIGGAYLLTTTDTGAKAVPGFGLHLDDHGLSVDHPDGSADVHVPWSGVTRLTATETDSGPDGRPGLVIEVVTNEGHHRFVAPTAEPDRLRAALQTLPGWHKKRSRFASVALVVLLAVLIAAAAAAGALAGLGKL